MLRVLRVQPDRPAGDREPQTPVGALEGAGERAELRGESRESVASAEALSGDAMSRILLRPRDLRSVDMGDAGQAIEPQVSVRPLDDAGDPPEHQVILRDEVVKAAAAVALQTGLAADPDIMPPSGDRGHVADVQAVVRAEDAHTITVQHRELVPGEAEPDASGGVRELRDHPGLREIVPAAVESPDTVRQPVKSVASQRDPQAPLSILRQCL